MAYQIPIERLTEGVEIQIIDTFYGTDSRPAEVIAVEFDGEGYLVQSRLIENERVTEMEAEAYYPAGSTVEHCYEHEPRWMRSRAAVTAEEWEALENNSERTDG